MRQLRDAIAVWSAAGLRLAGATLVKSDGSTPHQLGLSMAVSETGDTVGALSGGCVDADVVLACDRVLAGGGPEVLRFGADDEGTSDLACGGVLTVWVHELAPAAIAALLTGEDAAVVTRRRSGRIDQYSVSRCATTDCPAETPVTDSALAIAARWLSDSRRRTELVTSPGGEELFLEAFARRGLFIVVGSSGYTEALCAQAELLGYQTAVIEPRPRFAAGITFAGEVIGSWPDVALQKLSEHGRLDDRAAIVVCTHDPKFDEPALEAALATSAGFIGALGSRTTSAGRFERLRARGVTESALRRIHSPVGLDLGGASPAETAVSVAAEIIAVARGRTAAPLRDTSGPLHVR